MSFSLDFNNISTWENIDPVTACKRLSSEKNDEGYNLGALRVSSDLFQKIKDTNRRAQLFLNCETLGLRGWKLFFAYEYPCNRDYDNFVQCVMKSDAAMIQAIIDHEKRLSHR